jgi:hypothetical protein
MATAIDTRVVYELNEEQLAELDKHARSKCSVDTTDSPLESDSVLDESEYPLVRIYQGYLTLHRVRRTYAKKTFKRKQEHYVKRYNKYSF